jgi:ribose transport system ATP-binding protein
MRLGPPRRTREAIVSTSLGHPQVSAAFSMPQTTLATPRLRMTGVRKSFGATRALDGVDFEVQPGQVHALIGENGAGKSTLMKVLAGVHAPDAGDLAIDGQPYQPEGPLDARRRGVAMIYQELALAPHLSVADNVLLGVEPASAGFWGQGRLDHAAAARLAREALETLGHPEIRPGAPLSSLSIGAQQLVEIARALVTQARIIVLDEPTSSLARLDVERLFEVVRRLAGQGVSIVYISHFLEEVEQISDSFTVLRDGRSVGSGATGQIGREEIIRWMVGRELKEMFPRVPHSPREPILNIEKLAVGDTVRQASFELRRGEILGIAGLIGAGRTEMLRAIFGLEPVVSGRVRLAAFEGPASPARRLGQGLGMLSEDRKNEGLAVSLPVEDNLVLSRLDPYARYGWLSGKALRQGAAGWITKLGIRTAGPDSPVASLSGGNQQKVQLARLLHHDCDVLLLDEPTRGIDVASKVQIYEWIGRLAAAGKAVLFVSSYIPELLGICDRVAVMHRGRLTLPAPVEEWDEHSIMLAATGAHRQHEVA